MEVLPTKFISRLKSLQKKRGMCIKDYANFLTVAEGRICDFLQRKSLPSTPELQIMAAKENVRVEWLAGMDVPKQSPLTAAQQNFIARKWEKSVKLNKECEALAAQCLTQGRRFSDDYELLNKNAELDDIRNWCDILTSLSSLISFKH